MPGMAGLLSPSPVRGQHMPETSERRATPTMRDCCAPIVIISFVFMMYREIGRKEEEA
jgi:hypothetical protein